MSPRREVSMPVASEPRVSKGLIAGILAAVLAIALLAALALQGRDDDKAASSAVPTGSDTATVSSEGVVTVGKGGKTVDLYEDFQCPACGAFEKNVGTQLSTLAEEGKVTLNYHPVNFLDARLGTDHSTRAANAAWCAADAGQFQKVHDAIFAAQPAKEGDGWTDDQLKAFGKEAGLSGEALTKYEGCVIDKPYAGFAKKANDVAFGADGITGTPTVKVDGKDADMQALYADPDAWLASLTK